MVSDEEASSEAPMPAIMVSSGIGSKLKPLNELVELDLQNVTFAPMASTATGGSDQKRKVVLSNVTTKVLPYQLTAWMGPSGCGKTSLISVAAGLTASGDLTQESIIKVNGSEGRVPKRLVGVVWQDDLLLSNLTVEETIFFAARLKSSRNLSDDDVWQVVSDTINDLGLSHVRQSMIGSSHGRRGLSGGERKRVSVGVELVVRPSVILLDEPTSGLDATSAQALVMTLESLASLGHAIAVVIHQPRTTIFDTFKNLLLLSHGQVVYNGKTCNVRAHLESCPTLQSLPAETGIADWIIDVITSDESQQNGGILVDHWKCNAQKIDLLAATAVCRPQLERQKSSLAELQASPQYEASFWTQFVLLTNRCLKQQRGEKLTRVGILLTLLYTVCTGIFWFRLPDDTSRVYDRNSVLFFMIIAQGNGIVVSSINVFHQERALLKRERAKKLYRVSAYFLAKTLSDMSNNVLLPTLYCAITYWVVNLRASAIAYFQFLLSIYLILSTAQSMGLFFSVAISNTQIALVLAPPITLFAMIIAGFYIPFQNLNVAIEWASYLSFARYGYSALLINEYSGRDIPCADEDVALQFGDGEECPLPGDEVIATLGLEGITTDFWFNLVMVVVLQVFFRVASYHFLRRDV